MTDIDTNAQNPEIEDNDSQLGPILQPPRPEEIRAELQQLVLNDLMGPAGGPEEEVDEDRVRERYLVGMLAPRKQKIQPEEMDELAVSGTDSEDGTTESNALPATTLLPSSLGMTFSVDGEASQLTVTARWGQYTRVESETLVVNKTGNPKNVWKRTPMESSIDIPLNAGAIRQTAIIEEQPAVVIQGRIRKNDGGWIVTLFLVNNQEEPKARRDEAWVFQPELIVESSDGEAVFVRNPLRRKFSDSLADLEERTMVMLYRDNVEFAVGHGTAVHSDISPDNPKRAVRLKTTVVPTNEVLQQTPPTVEEIPELANLVLDMKELSETNDDEFEKKLQALPQAYEAWINEHNKQIMDPDSDLREHSEAAQNAMQQCSRVLQRIREGITLLSEDKHAAESFRFANRAMWLQRTHTIYVNQIRRRQKQEMLDVDVPKNHRWYPFQLAFILLNLPSVTDLHHHDRCHETKAIADLLWFPTGGGKTEAYLGLSAYTLGLRRLQGEIEGRNGEHGVAVLMRYTLRVLTLQQFQRATALVCACESIRRDELDNGSDKWGKVPFRIGLWVGMRTTPNTTEQSAEAIRQDHGHYNPNNAFSGVGSPVQLTFCPWCGAEIKPGRHIKVESGMSQANRTFIYCGDPDGECIFSERKAPKEGLPALVVDEEIYRHLPSLLIATVDKFAQMPWKGEVQMLFGQVNAYCPRHGFRSPETDDRDSHQKSGILPAVKSIPHGPLRPPDLIIQDELHLLSGPLGSLVGLYETAVDELASWTVDGVRVRPKVIASTATIRRAQSQVNDLFMRSVDVFPPHGTEIGDNFFSIQRKPDEKSGRIYIGICAMGKRFPVALIRAYVAFLAASQTLYEKYDAGADPWMTLVGYFNSIRELGGTRRLVEDDISSRLRDADLRGLAKRKRPFLRELTSRISASDIPKILDIMEVGFNQANDAKRLEQRRANQKVDSPDPIDVLLATNMISVGVDVGRLGLMLVAGQPKTTAEYIQATSRVGRNNPGLVCAIYNWARPRDLSHFERFEHYHSTFYQNVEAPSVTPFATRALDRGLSAVLVSLLRLQGSEYNANERAERLDPSSGRVSQAINSISNRAALVKGENNCATDVQQRLMTRIDQWVKAAENHVGGAKLGYRRGKDGLTLGLLKKAGSGKWDKFTCLNSLRDVEPEISLILDERGSLGYDQISNPNSVDGGDK
ncbi:MAG: DISARM system helicase DrmA [Armatimonadetes bacterium]|nr:DISARM system helicase DrmA [Armatimonadota bacterium]